MTTRGHHGILLTSDSGDPYWDYVVSVINDFGADGSTDWTDEKGHIWTPNGDVVVDRDNPSFPEGAMLFDGSGDYVDAEPSADWQFGTSPFCIEGFCLVTGSGNRAISSFLSNNTYYIDGFNNQYFYDGSINVLSGGGFSAGSRRHFALTRDELGVGRLFEQGALMAAGTLTINVSSTNFRWGAATGGSPSSFFSGLIGRRRITKGVARYTAAFTPPSGPFPTS